MPDSPQPLEIALHTGPRDELAPLFAEADDSPAEIAGYWQLGEVLVARRDGVLLGHLQIVQSADPGLFELKSLAVVEEWRSHGVGTALVEAALRHCRKRDGHQLLVATAAASIGALQFYQRLGFRIHSVIRDFYVSDRGYRPIELNGIPLLDEVILDMAL